MVHGFLIQVQISRHATYLNTFELWALKAQTATARQFQELAALQGWIEESATKKVKTCLNVNSFALVYKLLVNQLQQLASHLILLEGRP